MSFSFETRYTVTRITLFRFADTTSASVPQSKDFSGARESASSPAVSKINVPAASAPRTATVYHFSSHAVNRRAQKIKSKIAKIAKTSKSRHEFSGMASQRANRIFSSRQDHALKYIDSTQYLGKVAALPTEVLIVPYRGIGRTLPRYWLRPTEVLVAPYRGIGCTLPRYWRRPCLCPTKRYQSSTARNPRGDTTFPRGLPLHALVKCSRNVHTVL